MLPVLIGPTNIGPHPCPGGRGPSILPNLQDGFREGGTFTKFSPCRENQHNPARRRFIPACYDSAATRRDAAATRAASAQVCDRVSDE